MARWNDPYAVEGRWYRGNSHLHTFHGPGDSIATDPEVVVEWYRSHGYHWLNISDHAHVTRVEREWEGFVVLSGHESDCVVAIGVEGRADVADGPFEVRAERLALWAEDIGSRDGVAQLAHPRATLRDWRAHLEWLLNLEGISLIELYNNRQGDYGGQIDWQRECKYGVEIWDQLLLAGKRIWPAAVDDSHDYLSRPRLVGTDPIERVWEPIYAEEEQFFESGGGWTCALAEQLTPQHLKAAMRRGSVYASQGPAFATIGIRQGALRVEATACEEIRLVVDGAPVAQFPAPRLEWDLPEPSSCRYVRVELVDGCGRRAWSAPFHSG